MSRLTPTLDPTSAHRLVVRDLTVSYNRVPALHHIAFELGCGESVALLGPNGAGKSTLLKSLVGLLPRETGSITFHGREVAGATKDFAYLPQRENIDWDFPTTVRGLVEMGRYLRLGWWRRFREEDCLAVDEAIAAMRLETLHRRQISALSGGQQQRAFLARALAQQAHVFLLDEPFTGLDKPSQDNLKEMLRTLRGQGKLIIASHHDLQTVSELFDRVILLNGELIAEGPVAEVFTEANIHKTYHTAPFTGPAGRPHHHHH
ncbi:ABC transporter-related protein [Chthoniobacter flavus Ellin428]|uniref:ABC transporter-related protein n=1 Tax=Chthoniobacter flavus Ellin428 TaxID=497964 RepID=B4CV67_9BACT|nr:metal ABC transporter ATP-binding protein [Chthoniobacter flavus]EDY22455.1 ABC transporter-related protein [Chthoniobacter flavus Ellin428]TCO94537.1 manganese/iron transport system ATP-binding protein/manganese/zinc/iron transport system ATP- binding protein [Chthoniobacter flavus]